MFLSPPQVICVAENEETGGTSPRLHLALVLSFVIFILVAIIAIIFAKKTFLGHCPYGGGGAAQIIFADSKTYLLTSVCMIIKIPKGKKDEENVLYFLYSADSSL